MTEHLGIDGVGTEDEAGRLATVGEDVPLLPHADAVVQGITPGIAGRGDAAVVVAVGTDKALHRTLAGAEGHQGDSQEEGNQTFHGSEGWGENLTTKVSE